VSAVNDVADLTLQSTGLADESLRWKNGLGVLFAQAAEGC
jgi:hypothetical protein